MAADGSIFIDLEHFPGPDATLGTADDLPAPSCPCGICGPLSMAITFRAGTLGEGSLFPGIASTSHFITSTPPNATLSRLVTGISITSYAVWTATRYTLDQNNNVIASDTRTRGSSFFLDTLSVSAGRPLRRFTVLPVGCQIGGGWCDPILNLSSLVLIALARLGPPGIPTVSEWGLFGLLMLLGTAAAVLLGQSPVAGTVRGAPSNSADERYRAS